MVKLKKKKKVVSHLIILSFPALCRVCALCGLFTSPLSIKPEEETNSLDVLKRSGAAATVGCNASADKTMHSGAVWQIKPHWP